MENDAGRRIGIVDLGSNTARLAVFSYQPGKCFRLVDEIRELVRLGESLGRSGALSEAAMERASAALRLYAKYRESMDLEEVRVVASSAVRDAANGADFLQRVENLALPIEILTGEAEARLGVQAVANGFSAPDAWVIDLGGGSAQVSLMRRRGFVEGRAYPLGAVRLTEIHLEDDPPTPAQIQSLEDSVSQHLAGVARRIRQGGEPIIAIGGTIRNLARSVQNSTNYPLDLLHGYHLGRSPLEHLTSRLLKLTTAKRKRVPGINPDRADIILAGALVFRWLLRESHRDGLWISGQGVREGVFYQHFLPAPYRIDDIRSFSIQNIFQRYPQDERHTQHVEFLARRLFEELSPLHGMGADELEMLQGAARLHDIGMRVGYHQHHKHGAYLIGSSILTGFSHRELALLMLLVRYHRRGSPKWGEFAPLSAAGDKRRLLQLATCLRLAEFLERSRGGRIHELRLIANRRTAKLVLQASEHPYVEIWETRKQAPLFEQAFQRKLELETAGHS